MFWGKGGMMMVEMMEMWGMGMKRIHYQTVVIGGGAAGYAAACTLADEIGGKMTAVVEKQTKAGRKLLATGNGRCNISNEHISLSHYHGDEAIAERVLSSFSAQDMRTFFGKLGVMLRTDSEGRIYPYSNQAVTILSALQEHCRRKNVCEMLSFEIQSVRKENGVFIITSPDMTITSEKLIFACGSKAAPKLGADDSGFALLSSFGIHPTALFPSLSPVYCAEKRKNLKGVRAKGKALLVADGKPVKTTFGEIQFIEKGLSGICIFELSRYVNEFLSFGTVGKTAVHTVSIELDLVQELSFRELLQLLENNRSIFSRSPAVNMISGILPQALSGQITKECGLSEKPCSSLTSRDLKLLTKTIKQFSFTPETLCGFDAAQVCAGGIDSTQINPDTLMSRNVRNLYLCGEMLNVDGDCGGFNLHFAVGSGILAAKHISKTIT